METSRRNFLKAGGACLLGLSLWPAVRVLAGDGPDVKADAGALKGKRWGLVIDMRKCWPQYQQGCRDCMLACRREHNIPVIDNKDEEVKWLWTEPYKNAFPEQEHAYTPAAIADKPFLVACNHCDNPPCVRVCPTKATFKRPDGIVTMDYHRCLGCRYCMAACPYGARSFNFQDPRPFIKEENLDYPTREKGVVEKCNFCAERLDKGQQPACVEACRVGALIFGDLDDPNSEVRKILAERNTIRRKPELGTHPSIYYLV